VDWALILIVAGVVVVGAFALAAAMAAGGSDRAWEGTAGERAATWQAGGSPHELRLLAGLAALARVDLDASEVEIVVMRGRDGIVVTGSRLPSSRMGETVAFGEGLAGQALAAGRTTVAGAGEDAGRQEALVAIAAPIPGPDGLAGVVVATAGERLLRARDVDRLEALASETGARLAVRAADIRHAG
jgi:hypothetical protein